MDWLERAFAVCIFFYTAFGACNLTHRTWVISAALYAMTAVGAVLLVYRAASFRKYIKTPLLPCAVLMWLSYLASAFFNRAYINKDAVVFFAMWTLFFFLLYAHDGEEDPSHVYRNLRLFSILHMGWTTLLALISFGMLFANYDSSYVELDNGSYTVAAGIHEGRLWGAFQDPNLGAVMCVAVIALCVYWYRRCGKKWLRGALIADGVVMLLYIAMSDSRNGMLCLGVVCAVGLCFYWFDRKRRKQKLTYYALGIVLACVALAAGFCAPKLVQRGYNAAAELVVESAPKSSALKKIERDYKLNKTIADQSNRRFWVWQSGIDIAMSRPLTGVSFVGVVPYAEEHMPDTYIVNNDYWDMNTFDSEIFNLFAAQGFPGLIILIVWFALAVILFFRCVGRMEPGDKDEIAILTVLVCVLITSALNQGTMFYQMTPNAVLFWLAFGDLLFVLAKARRREV